MNIRFFQYRDLLVRYLKPRARQVLLLAALLFGGIALQLVNPQVIRFFIDTAQAGGPQRALLTAAVVFIAISLLQRGVALAASYTAENTGWAATNALRKDLVLHCLRLDMPFHKKRTPGELIERIDGDVTGLANFFSQFTLQVLGNGLLVVGILALLFREDWRIGLGLTLYTGVTLLLLSMVQRLAVARWTAARQAAAEQYGFLEERISGAEEIRAIGAEPYVLRRLYQLMRAFLEKFRAAFMVFTLTYSLTNLLSAFGFAAGLGFGIYLYVQGQASIGTAYLIVHYIGMLSSPLQNLREQAQDLQQATASIQRIEELLHLQPEVHDPFVVSAQALTTNHDPFVVGASAPKALATNQALSITFSDVTFHYEEDQDVLQNVSFQLQPGKVIGVLGRTGSGKTTLTRLLFRLYDPSGGVIRLNGTDVRALPLADLRARVGMVTQDVQLFHAPVRDNLAFFNRLIDDGQIERALKELHLWDWAQSLPEGLDTPLAAGGQGLSAGEAQLLAFTRVFLKDPGLVILDEASSRLDPATEYLLEQAVDRLFARRTAIIIAHRLHTVHRADEILILEGGRVVEYGPRALLAGDPGSRFYSLLQTGLEEALV